MRDHYDFSKMKGRKNPYIKYLKQPVTMRLDCDTVAYFRSIAEEAGIPYQGLINLYLRDCAVHYRKLQMKWASLESEPSLCPWSGARLWWYGPPEERCSVG